MDRRMTFFLRLMFLGFHKEYRLEGLAMSALVSGTYFREEDDDEDDEVEV